MSTAASVLGARVDASLKGTGVAAQAGIAAATWASVLAPRIFRGIGAKSHGKSRGRCPYLEYEVIAGAFDTTTPGEGGALNLSVRVRAHVATRDYAAGSEQLFAILSAGLAAIRSQTADNLTALGDDRIGDVEPGPMGLMREAVLDVQVTFNAADYEVT